MDSATDAVRRVDAELRIQMEMAATVSVVRQAELDADAFDQDMRRRRTAQVVAEQAAQQLGTAGEIEASPLGPPPPSPPPMTAEPCDEQPAQTGPVPEIPPELAAALEASGEQLIVELQALDTMPQVRLTGAAVFDRAKLAGSDPNKRGVICKLLCCSKQFDVKCNRRNGPGACPTVLEAAQQLRAKVARDHGPEACLEKAGLARASQGTSSTAPPEDAFAVMLGAAVARSAVQRRTRRSKTPGRRRPQRRPRLLPAI